MNNQIINIMNESIDETQSPNAAVHLTWKRKRVPDKILQIEQ